jgi:broad specificity phosphatase PhoE
VAQAHRAAGRLVGESIAAVYSSDLRRALDTAGPISRALGLAVTVDVRLRERAFGVLEGGPSALLTGSVSGIVGDRVVDADAAPEGGESVRQLVRRVAGFLDELDDGPMGDVALVVHGGVVRAAIAHLDAVDLEGMPWGRVDNGEIFTRTIPTRRAPGIRCPSPLEVAT